MTAAITGREALEAFLRQPVSCETINAVPYETKRERLAQYAALLQEWTQKINLIAASTLPDLWVRHFLDSAQLAALLPPATRCLVDLGSGAGFPGLVLACLGVPEVHLVESIGKKASFLTEVAKELKLPVTVHPVRAETIRGLKADVVTARAVTALPDLVKMAAPFMKNESVALFLKGEKAPAELTEAQKYWTFTCTASPSVTSSSGTILTLSKLKAHRPHDLRQRPRRK